MQDHRGVLVGPAPPDDAQVVVAGGGPTGLAAALELGRRGVRCVLVEPRPAPSDVRPRAKTTSVRTMEHFRRWGLADRLREAAYLPVAWSQDVVFCTTLLGTEITRFSGCFGLTVDRSPLFAETSQQVPQFVVEAVLREALASVPSVTAAYGWAVGAVDARRDDVVVDVSRPDGERQVIRGQYLLGCDGPSSVVRRAIGAVYVGRQDARQNLTAVFRAPQLAGRVPHGPAIQYWVLRPGAAAYMGRLDLDDRWWIGLIGVEPGLSETEVVSCIQRAIGEPVEVELLGTDPWTSRMLVADRFGTERVFLCGDAAHLNPPWGGHGFNTGIGDAVNIAWKLAAVVHGWGAPGLLETYDVERRPVAEETVALAGRHAALLAADFADPVLAEDSPRGASAREAAAREIGAKKFDEFHGLGLVLGYHYERSPITVSAAPKGHDRRGGAAGPLDVSNYVPSARPGHRLPHSWLAPSVSLYDRLGEWYSLLALGHADPAPLVDGARRVGVPLQLVDLRDHALDLGAPLVLVRPDQHIAWRGEAPPADEAARVLDAVRGARCRP